MTKHVRTFTAVLLITAGALALAGSAVSAPSARTIENREKFCRYGSVDGTRTWTHHEVRKTIACAARRFGVSYDLALAIALRESGLNENADNPTSSASGVFQHLLPYWPGRVAGFNRTHPRWNAGPSVWNARSNVVVSVWMMSKPGGLSNWGY